MTEMRFTCRGSHPLLMHNLIMDELKALADPDYVPPARTAAEKLASKLYKDENGAVGITPLMVLECLMRTGRMLRTHTGRRLSTQTTSLLKDKKIFEIVEPFLPFPAGATWSVHEITGTLLGGGQEVRLELPRFDEWSFTVTVRFDEEVISQETMCTLFSSAGGCFGLGAFRVSSHQSARLGVFGLFMVERSEVVSERRR